MPGCFWVGLRRLGCACLASRPVLVAWQVVQADWRLSLWSVPPWAAGVMWSTSVAFVVQASYASWQTPRSRVRM